MKDKQTGIIGRRLRELRDRAQLTQEELAQRAGLHVQEIAKLEGGVRKRPSFATVSALADALKVSLEAFRDGPMSAKKRPAKKGQR